MDKIHFQKKTLVRIEHFWILILTLDGRRFSISADFKDIVRDLNGSDIDFLVSKYGMDLWKEKIIKLIDSLVQKWILIFSKAPLIELRIIENDYISNDCLSFPRTIYWELTQKCNLKCIHCYSSSQACGFEWLEFPIIKKTLDEFIEKGVEFLNIWWWEPLLYKDVYKTLEYGISKWLMIEMTTNGMFINKRTIEKLKHTWLRFIQISLDGSNKEIYEKIRIWSRFSKVVSSIRDLIESGFVVSVNTVLMRPNKGDILDIIKLCEALKVNYFKVSPLMETGRAVYNSKSLQLSIEEYREIYEQLIQYKNSSNDNGMKIIFYQNILRPEIKNIEWMPNEHFWCPAWRTTCWIDSYWNVFPCSYMNHKELICWNIKDSSFLQIWKDSETMSEIRNVEKLTWKCSKCRFLKLCRWWCRAMAYLKSKKLNTTDPLCVVNNI